MEDTIGSIAFDPFKGQRFRITYKSQDFEVKLLKREVQKGQTELEVLLDGMVQRLIKKDGKWSFENIQHDQEFANDIWRAISLRYRL